MIALMKVDGGETNKTWQRNE